ncbi:hypothetical protein L596_026450 [Steinernema carpocapsae]|uniref:Uncharacterized protein n=1 Tax=Steinernema carpocapsae TaxID=34508 RepID=A0A4U5M1J1_STECR|nr:hypothetical protein L596_026450 [Steinernema carpocapsae]
MLVTLKKRPISCLNLSWKPHGEDLIEVEEVSELIEQRGRYLKELRIKAPVTLPSLFKAIKDNPNELKANLEPTILAPTSEIVHAMMPVIDNLVTNPRKYEIGFDNAASDRDSLVGSLLKEIRQKYNGVVPYQGTSFGRWHQIYMKPKDQLSRVWTIHISMFGSSHGNLTVRLE